MIDLATSADVAIRALVAGLHPQAIIWFGSASREQGGPDSDLDFLIVAPRAAGAKGDLRRKAQHAIWDVPAPIDLLIYYPDEFAEQRDALGSVVREAMRTGKVVYGHV